MLRLIRDHLAPYRTEVGVIVALQLVGTIALLYLPSLNADIIDLGVATGDTGVILLTGAWMLAVSLLQIVVTIVAVYLSARTSMGLGRDMRAAIFHKVGEFSAQEMSRYGAPTLISRNTNDVTQVQSLVFVSLAMMVSAPITMIGGVIMALRQDVGLSWLVVVAVPMLAIAVGAVIVRMIPQFRIMQKGIDNVNRVLREQITGIRVVRAFVREDVETDRFAVANGDLTAAALAVGRLQAIIFPIVIIILNTSTVAVLWFGAARVESGEMLIGSLLAFMAYLMQILIAVMMSTFMAMMIPRASVSAERIGEVLATEASVVPAARPVGDLGSPVTVRFDEVDFHYPGAEASVLHDVTFEARPGTTTAIVGSTGAGKSTLMALIPRLFDAADGAIRVNGVDVRDVDFDVLWSHLGYVPQRPYLFSGTVASTLRYGKPDATDDELWSALEIAQAADFVRAMPGGLDAPISQGGTNVSGGQRQRLAIARALVRRRDIYLFDDSFSALDLQTDARLRAALREITGESTVITVAQRVSTVRDADRIIVLEAGRIVGQGRHDELLVTCPTYAEIAESQRGLDEAEQVRR